MKYVLAILLAVGLFAFAVMNNMEKTTVKEKAPAVALLACKDC